MDRLWAPPLPASVRVDDDAATEAHDLPGTQGLPLALADLPDEQRHALVRWDPIDGSLGVGGRSRSGRTTTLATVGRMLLARGHVVHAVGGPALLDLIPTHRRTGTTTGTDDAPRAVRLVRALTAAGRAEARARRADQRQGAGGPRDVLLVDDVADLRTLLESVPDASRDPLTDLVRSGTAVVVAGSAREITRLAPDLAGRIILAAGDRHEDVADGMPPGLAGGRAAPGRGVWMPAPASGTPAVCQVLLGPGRRDTRGGDDPQAGTSPRAGEEIPAAAPLRITALPERVAAADLDPCARGVARDGDTGRPGRDAAQADGSVRPLRLPVGLGGDDGDTGRPGRDAAQADGSVRPLRLPVGLGGDDGGTVALDVCAGAVVAGPPGSGRSTALRTIAEAAAARGALLGTLGLPWPGSDQHLPEPRTAAQIRAAIDAWVSRLVEATDGASGRRAAPPLIVVVDDLDRLGARFPAEVEALARVRGAGGALVAGTSLEGAASTHRGPLPELRAGRAGIVLGASDRRYPMTLGGRPVWTLIGPNAAPGRGTVVDGSTTVSVQIAEPSGDRQEVPTERSRLRVSGSPRQVDGSRW
ncbi:hypothetical protein GCM10025865_21250 [Paraoerskovia sediminicola]|uniref:AAA+ ATPase domain-containing protein n=1 Tax=Paraoerskovia sediminicola TaxID=1138587 RepID=A0ABN6XGT3_9CELL|nr:hypothetical protein [Paraoerskovia sediminicola]BDZ42826.1 hypothetical protein GCM10025865_21250 [Paraoerskovia sediminicola]